MPAHSFDPEWVNPLLRCNKQGTTRPQHTQVKVGDIVSIYNQQRRRIIDKPIMELTDEGCVRMEQRIKNMKYPLIPFFNPPQYYAHLLGKVEITEVYAIHPCEMTEDELKAWAVADGFKGFHPTGVFPEQLCAHEPGANMWFQRRYGDDWMQRWWTVERWHGWVERYFEPEEV